MSLFPLCILPVLALFLFLRSFEEGKCRKNRDSRRYKERDRAREKDSEREKEGEREQDRTGTRERQCLKLNKSGPYPEEVTDAKDRDKEGTVLFLMVCEFR